jgi:hypothetical protein
MNAANGWNGTTISNGQTVRVWDKAIRGTKGRGVVEGIVSDCGDKFCTVTITKVTGKASAYERGNRITVGCWWLEPVA